jgi:hypothetical protein
MRSGEVVIGIPGRQVLVAFVRVLPEMQQIAGSGMFVSWTAGAGCSWLTASDSRVGLRRGREERSCNPSIPSSR